MLGALVALPALAKPRTCNARPAGLTFHRKVGDHVGRLSWRVTPGPRASGYRVFRNGEVVGQTRGHSLQVAVRPGQRYRFSVRSVSAAGKATSCGGTIERRIHYHPPGRPHHLEASDVGSSSVLLSWSAARPGDGQFAGYRIFKNRRVARQVKRTRAHVAMLPQRTYRFSVAAVDSRGRLSKATAAVRVRSRRHRAPGTPKGLRVARVTDTEVGLLWSTARGSSRIAGYRVFRDGSPLRQVKGTSGDISNLAPATGYRFTVAAVDSLGYVSPQSAPIAVTTAMPPPTEGRAHAFLLATTGESFRDLQRHYRQIGTVYPTYFDCPSGSPTIRGADDPLVTRWAQLRKIQVLARYDCQRPSVLHTILTDQSARASVIAGLVSLVQTYGYDGINVDFEAGYASDRNALTSFVTDLGSQLHALGKKISVEVSAKWQETYTGRSGFYDYAALGAVADYVFVMNWGWHWTTSSPGPSDEFANALKVADYTGTMPNKGKYVLGAPLYAHDWANGGGPSNPSEPIEYGDVLNIITQHGGTPVLNNTYSAWHYTYDDAVGYHDVWYGDATTIAHRIRLARNRGLGIGFWRLGLEDQRIWDDPLLASPSAWP